ncbi:6-phosphofructokinase [Calidithermus roseus]|uniref:ATP-dependent 6-phosphofructokinase n=1 Tax=Calidithermus roseus TaxID=1644118 RepID=A0A399ETK2_9DEIN|nr:6-phosphofructokinase [Calidithermus roseus]RIH87045.1 ATP-dependent 6-phosphofructokinase 1 [Calidithermus roseus]
MKRIGVFTSGGDAPGMNAAIRAVVRTGTAHGLEIVGIRRGYQGMIDGDFTVLGPRDVANTLQRGGTVLLTARSKEFTTEEGRAKAARNLKDARIDGVVCIGGDGSYRGALKLAEEHRISIVGAPGTIDNDLYGTDYTIGFDTAVNTALDAIDRIRDTAASHERVFFIEVMGRHAGFIALEVGIAGGAEVIVLPEDPTTASMCAQVITDSASKGKRSSIVVVAEGGYEGGAEALARDVKLCCGIEGRVTILGHIQRGGSPTAIDRVLASRLGAACVEALLSGASGVGIGLVNDEIRLTPFKEAVEKRKDINRRKYELARMLAL